MVRRKGEDVASQNRAQRQFEAVEVTERYYVIAAVALAIVYFVLSYLSKGFYQDDEVGHFATAYRFWNDPFSIMGYWSRPGFKILYVLPSLLGIKAVQLVSALFAAATAYVTSLVAKEYGMKNRLLVMVLCGFQPLFYQISFRTYAEVVGALLLALLLLFYERKRYLLVAVISSYLFAVRQEFVALSLVLGIFFIFRRQWVAFLLLAWTPLVLGLIGWLKTGNPTWLLSDFLGGGENPGHFKPGFLQYFKAFAPIFGTTIAALFLVGFFAPMVNRRAQKGHLSKYHALYVAFLALFLINSVLSSPTLNISPGQGIWRYILPITPVVALFALLGFNVMWGGDTSARRIGYVIMTGFLVLVVAFFSHTHNYYVYLEPKDSSRTLVLIALLLLFWAAHAMKWKTRPLMAAIAILTIAHTVQSEPPLKMSEENKTVQSIVEWWRGNNYQARPVLVNHIMFEYFAGLVGIDTVMRPGLTLRTMREAPPGSILVWESHYGSRPEYGADAPFDSIRANRSLRPLRQFISSDQRFGAIVFEKIDSTASR